MTLHRYIIGLIILKGGYIIFSDMYMPNDPGLPVKFVVNDRVTMENLKEKLDDNDKQIVYLRDKIGQIETLSSGFKISLAEILRKLPGLGNWGVGSALHTVGTAASDFVGTQTDKITSSVDSMFQNVTPEMRNQEYQFKYDQTIYFVLADFNVPRVRTFLKKAGIEFNRDNDLSQLRLVLKDPTNKERFFNEAARMVGARMISYDSNNVHPNGTVEAINTSFRTLRNKFGYTPKKLTSQEQPFGIVTTPSGGRRTRHRKIDVKRTFRRNLKNASSLGFSRLSRRRR